MTLTCLQFVCSDKRLELLIIVFSPNVNVGISMFEKRGFLATLGVVLFDSSGDSENEIVWQ